MTHFEPERHVIDPVRASGCRARDDAGAWTVNVATRGGQALPRREVVVDSRATDGLELVIESVSFETGQGREALELDIRLGGPALGLHGLGRALWLAIEPIEPVLARLGRSCRPVRQLAERLRGLPPRVAALGASVAAGRQRILARWRDGRLEGLVAAP